MKNKDEPTTLEGVGSTDGLGMRPKFVVEQCGGLHCLYLAGQSGPYIGGFIEPGEAQAIKEALNLAMIRAGCVAPNVEVSRNQQRPQHDD